MERRVKDWMFVSIALFLAEVGRLIGGHFRYHWIEWSLDTLAVLLIVIMMTRFLLQKWRNRR